MHLRHSAVAKIKFDQPRYEIFIEVHDMPVRSRRDAAIEDAAAERETLLDAEANEEDA